MKLDSNQLIMSGGDGGDSCNKVFTAHLRALFLDMSGQFDKIPKVYYDVAAPFESVEKLEVTPGIYCRNPDPSSWTSDPRNVSRDQLDPVIRYLAARTYLRSTNYSTFYKSKLDSLLWQCLKRFMFAQNIYPNWVDPRKETVKKKVPDPITPDLWASFARGYLKTIFAPIALAFVLFGDFYLIFAALARCFLPKFKDGTLQIDTNTLNDVDDDNINNSLMMSQYIFPTPFAWIARKLFHKFRKPTNGANMGETDPVMEALAWYNRNDNPEMTELARPLVKRY